MNEKIQVNDIIAEGIWGTCSWLIDTGGNLVINGGVGDSLTSISSSPWNKYKATITTVSFSQDAVVKDGSSLNYMFYGCSNLQSVNFSGFDTYGVTSMGSMFHSCSSLSHIYFGEDFDTSDVTNMSKMFYDCRILDDIDLNSFDTSKVIDMNSMFEGCDSLKILDLSSFDTSNVISMSLMFRNCTSLEYVNVSGFNTSKVTGISGLFGSCSSIKNIDLSHFDTSNVTNMISMFMNCKSLETVDLSGFDTSKVNDMNLMFCNCIKLEKVDLSDFNTSGVTDMGMMFSSCNNLKYVDVSGFDTSKVANMQNMFMYCTSLRSIDLSDFDTSNVEDMGDMFTGCDNLASITVGEKFSFKGNGSTLCVLPVSSFLNHDELKWTEASTGNKCLQEDISGNKHETYFIKGRDFTVLYDANGGIGSTGYSEFTFGTGETPDVLGNAFEAPSNYIFKEWNTKRDGSGYAYAPEDKLKSICSDVVLYAIWASTPAIYIQKYLYSVVYGNELDLDTPVIESNNGEITSYGVEISPDGIDDWEEYKLGDMLDVSYDGYYLRYYAENFVGRSYSQSVRIFIDKAVYNMDQVHWEYDEELIYNGKMKSVYLAGLPKGITAEYYGNRAIEVGEYFAGAKLYYDADNYQMPSEIDECQWEIAKGIYDMSAVRWSYTEAFVYDGDIKTVYLTDLPEGISVAYDGNQYVDSGVYTTVATFDVEDAANYEVPHEMICEWEIKKAAYDMSSVRWNYYGPFTYSNEYKTVILTGLPEGVTARYYHNMEVNAGDYLATAEFAVEDAENYEIPEQLSCQWKISKAHYDMSFAEWYYKEPFIYSGNMEAIVLTSLPEGVTAEYTGNCEVNAGTYTASASFIYDADNYQEPVAEDCQWEIKKASYDMSEVVWDYQYPYVYDENPKTVKLQNLPEGVTVHYEDNCNTDAGTYIALAILRVQDENNYNTPLIPDCEWEIKKASYDMSNVTWNYSSSEIYDGNMKQLELIGLPEGVSADYKGNHEVNAGNYTAAVILKVEDENNYNTPLIPDCEWEIKKASYDMSKVIWDYQSAEIYDGNTKKVELKNLPEEIMVAYEGNCGVDAGDYMATAVFSVNDSDNYQIPENKSLSWSIEKAVYDMSNVAWDYKEEFIYDETMKSVKLTGLPDGVTVKYIDNAAIYAGTYIASVIFIYDKNNYEMPTVENCCWSIGKANYDISHVKWSYDHEFVYDGNEKKIYLEGLPEGVTVCYENNSASNAGIYTATATLSLDDDNNYYDPIIEGCSWQIKKASYNMSEVSWAADYDLVYDGKMKILTLTGLPEDVTAEYSGNSAVDAGLYSASAVLSTDNDNYNTPVAEDHIWAISKADYDMSRASWIYNDELVYDGELKSVVLEGLPLGVSVVYHGNTAIDTGIYNAEVSVSVDDEENYNVPVIASCQWEIKKASYDMSRVHWNYEGDIYYDGGEKSVTLVNLPEGLEAEYVGCNEVMAGIYTASVNLRITAADHIDNYYIPEMDGCTWEIKKGSYDMSEVKWNYNEGMFEYDGLDKIVTLNGMPSGVTAVYSGNTKQGAGSYAARAEFVIDDTNNYNVPSAMEIQWEIKKGHYDISMIAWDYRNPFTYDGKEKSVFLTGVPVDVNVQYSQNIKTGAGAYEAEVTLDIDTDNYRQPVIDSCSWAIEKATPDISHVKWDYSGPFVYDGEEKRVRLIGLPDGITAQYEDCDMSEAGYYTAKAVLSVDDTDNYNNPSIEDCQWEIKRAVYDMSAVRWDYQEPFVYDSRPKGVYLTGLPEGITSEYTQNSFMGAGIYMAHAEFNYDYNNYEKPVMEGCRWEIRKAVYDMSNVSWYQDEEAVYDGTEKSVRLINLPEGISPKYRGNRQSTAGLYTADAAFAYDEDNYEMPVVDQCRWEIKKASYDMSNVKWSYTEPFTYDGTEKKIVLERIGKQESSLKRLFRSSKDVVLTGLPHGVTAEYTGNRGIDAGIYTATAILRVEDPQNYQIPEISDCRWEIKKAEHDMKDVAWGYGGGFIYDGEEKAIYLKGLPEGVNADYSGNTAINAGVYNANVVLSLRDYNNYRMPEAIEGCQWEIHKGNYDMSRAVWHYTKAFTYDGKEKAVTILNLPEGVNATYSGNTAIDAGSYIAGVTLTIDDTDNYNVPVMESCKWKINKATYNMSNVEWEYSNPFTYDETAKTIYLKNLPEGITAVYTDNSKIDAGTYIAAAQLDYDSDNYEKPVAEMCKWKIKKARYDMTSAKWEYNKPFVYDEGEKSIIMVGLPDDVTAIYTNNRAINAGKYTAKVDFDYDTHNYFEPETTRVCRWEIKKSIPHLTIGNSSYLKSRGDEAFFLEVETNADTLKFKAENPEIVTVSESGMVSILKGGKTRIWITAKGDNYEAVNEKVNVEILEEQ